MSSFIFKRTQKAALNVACSLLQKDVWFPAGQIEECFLPPQLCAAFAYVHSLWPHLPCITKRIASSLAQRKSAARSTQGQSKSSSKGYSNCTGHRVTVSLSRWIWQEYTLLSRPLCSSVTLTNFHRLLGAHSSCSRPHHLCQSSSHYIVHDRNVPTTVWGGILVSISSKICRQSFVCAATFWLLCAGCWCLRRVVGCYSNAVHVFPIIRWAAVNVMGSSRHECREVNSLKFTTAPTSESSVCVSLKMRLGNPRINVSSAWWFLPSVPTCCPSNQPSRLWISNGFVLHRQNPEIWCSTWLSRGLACLAMLSLRPEHYRWSVLSLVGSIWMPWRKLSLLYSSPIVALICHKWKVQHNTFLISCWSQSWCIEGQQSPHWWYETADSGQSK